MMMVKVVRLMSKRHPQNGPSLSSAPPKRRKPMTMSNDLADWHARQKAEQEEIERGAAIIWRLTKRSIKEDLLERSRIYALGKATNPARLAHATDKRHVFHHMP